MISSEVSEKQKIENIIEFYKENIVRCVEQNANEAALGFFEQMKQDGKIEIPNQVYNIVLGILSKQKDHVGVQKLFQQMKAPDSTSFLLLMTSMSQNKLQNADEVMNKAFSMGINLWTDVRAQRILLISAQDDIERTMNLFDKFQKQQTQQKQKQPADIITIYLDTCVQHQRLDLVQQLEQKEFPEVSASATCDLTLGPCVQIVEKFIHIYCLFDRMKRVFHWIDRARVCNYKVTPLTWMTFLDKLIETENNNESAKAWKEKWMIKNQQQKYLTDFDYRKFLKFVDEAFRKQVISDKIVDALLDSNRDLLDSNRQKPRQLISTRKNRIPYKIAKLPTFLTSKRPGWIDMPEI